MLRNCRATITIMVYVVRPWSCSSLSEMLDVQPAQLYTIVSYSSGTILAKQLNRLLFPEPLWQEEEKLLWVKFLTDMEKRKVSLAHCRKYQQISKMWYNENHKFGAILFWAPRSTHGSNILAGEPSPEILVLTAALLILKNTQWCFCKAQRAYPVVGKHSKQIASLFHLASLYHLAKCKFCLFPCVCFYHHTT